MQNHERGAAAVEFAILLPLLLMLVLGTIEFGRAYNAQITPHQRGPGRRQGHGHRQGSRPTQRRGQEGSGERQYCAFTDSDVTLSTTTCSTGNQVTLTISYNLSTLTGIAGPFPMTGKGVMLCGG